MVRYSKYKGRKKRAKYDPASPIGPQMWYNMVTKRLCGNACEPGNLEDPTLRSMYSSLHGADGQTAPSGRPDTNTTMPRTVQNLLVEKNSDVGKLHLEQAKQHLAKFDIVMFLDDFDTGLYVARCPECMSVCLCVCVSVCLCVRCPCVCVRRCVCVSLCASLRICMYILEGSNTREVCLGSWDCTRTFAYKPAKLLFSRGIAGFARTHPYARIHAQACVRDGKTRVTFILFDMMLRSLITDHE